MDSANRAIQQCGYGACWGSLAPAANFDTTGGGAPRTSAPHIPPPYTPLPGIAPQIPQLGVTVGLGTSLVDPGFCTVPFSFRAPGWAQLPPFPLAEEQGLVVYEASMSELLDRNMQAAGMVRPPGTDAHHVVSWKDTRAAFAQTVLSNAGIGINDAVNGVYLPRNQKRGYVTVGEVWHADIHSKPYYDEVRRRILAVAPGGVPISSNAVQTVLRQIANDIERGLFPK